MTGRTAPATSGATGRVLPYGAGALLVEVDDALAVGRLVRAIGTSALGEQVEVVPAARTVLVRVGDPRRGAASGRLAALRVALEDLLARHVVDAVVDATPGGADDLVEIPVRYDGEDLADVAGRVGLTVAELIALHSGTVFLAAFCGFTAGFCYMTGLPERLVLPRRPSPRPRVPANTVAIADIYCGVYPAATPGGWNLLGTTAVSMWDARRDPPSLVSPGQRVRFVPVT